MSVISNPPCSDYCLNTGLELDDSDLRVLVERDDGDTQRVGEPGEAVGLVLVVERVQHLDYKHDSVRCEGGERVGQLASH
jgi:hypothetical protein